jgi:hypothetical protein
MGKMVYCTCDDPRVSDTSTGDFPLNVMYWAVPEEGGYEVVDGQQRTISVCRYVEGEFAFNGRYVHNLQKDEREQLLGYKLMVYLCGGTDSERLEWFETINIAGEKLTDQELRNAVYSGSWVSDVKRYFSRTGGPAFGLGSDYVTGTPIRRDYLETVIKWITDGEIEGYMAINQIEPNANELWLYFQQVIAWVKITFPTYRREMKGLPWGTLYNEFKGAKLDPKKFEEEIKALMIDDDVTIKKGIYAYVLTRNEKHLSIRAFSEAQKRSAYERQDGRCANKTKCLTSGNSDGKQVFDIAEMEGDHIKPWSKGGKTEAANCQIALLTVQPAEGRNLVGHHRQGRQARHWPSSF